MEVVLLSGLSGSGKSTALAALEDSGFFSVDNLPVSFLKKFLEIIEFSNNQINKLAIVCDARDPNIESDIVDLTDLIKSQRNGLILIFLEADRKTLIKRFEQTRRAHPLSIMKGLPLERAIDEEQKLLAPIRDLADITIDTSDINVNELRRIILNRFRKDKDSLLVQIISFGFKYGLPPEADNVFDVRFIPNPFFIEELKDTTGLEKKTAEFVLNQKQTKEFIEIAKGFLDKILPLYLKEGKSYITIAFGCTGGKHRSVALAEFFGDLLKNKGYSVDIVHRDINR